ncbi:MAG TPA: RNHCP domain-containing protein [Candidatus Paceibacterota bacterium]
MVFRRVVEDFVCEKCGAAVSGGGYTNHCPRCLTSKHVDDKGPGDRASKCGGLMPAVAIEAGKGGAAVIVHRCQRCDAVRRCGRAPNDSDEAVLAVAGGA